MAGNDVVLEGFICPICMTDFKAPSHLTKHFEEIHNDDPEILRSLKGMRARFFCNLFVKKKLIESYFYNLLSLYTKRKSKYIGFYFRFVWQSQEKNLEAGRYTRNISKCDTARQETES